MLSVADAAELAEVLRENREFMAPWEPVRSDDYFTEANQRAGLEQALEAYALEAMVPLAIVTSDNQIIGRITINGITRGAAQWASLGYWVARSSNGKGVATSAVADAIEIAFGQLGLHRLHADTLLHNTASQRVLTRNGFRPFAVAPDYLKIAGRWQDFVMFYLLNPDHR